MEGELDSDEPFDFAIVLCDRDEEVKPSIALVARLQARRVAVALLVPERIQGALGTSETYFVVLCAAVDSQGLRTLCDILICPVQQDGLVCCDWVDLSNVVFEGARAKMWAVEAPNFSEALAKLRQQLAPFKNDEAYGVVATIGINETGSMRQFYALHNELKAIARQHAWVMVTAPYCSGPNVRISALVVTWPSTRYFRELVRQ